MQFHFYVCLICINCISINMVSAPFPFDFPLIDATGGKLRHDNVNLL